MNGCDFGRYLLLVVSSMVALHAVAFNCDTTVAESELNQGGRSQVYIADCRIETNESSPFVVATGKSAVFTVEQEIRLGPGFHVQRGGHFQSQFRECIRNPDPKTAHASWGSYDFDEDGERWLRLVAEAFVENFDGEGGFRAELNYTDDLTVIPDFYRDDSNPDFYRDDPNRTPGKDDKSIPVVVDPLQPGVTTGGDQGIDKGVLFFHIGHGGSASLHEFDVRNGSETGVTVSVDNDTEVATYHSDGREERIDYEHEMLLGNCSADGTKEGELRYLWLCACRSFAHGPRVIGHVCNDECCDTSCEAKIEYDRPSAFDGRLGDSAEHRNVFKRWGPVLSDNMRMACGISTGGRCSGNSIVKYLKENYFEQMLSVADSWGHAHAQEDYVQARLYDSEGTFKRKIHQTPLCIARGNSVRSDLRSPITEDLSFTEKPNPYSGALHVVSWEWDDTTRAPIEMEQTTLPVFLVKAWTPTWVAGEHENARASGLVKVALTKSEYYSRGDLLLSKSVTTDGRPRVKVHEREGTVVISGERKPVQADGNSKILSAQEYASAAMGFVEQQEWSEDDMDEMGAVRAILQVRPDVGEQGVAEIIKTQKDITFYIGRRIPLTTGSAKVFGTDNQIVVQMNNDATIVSASKRWREITGRIENVPVKSLKEAYAEAVKRLNRPGLYDLSTWDWGYKSITDEQGRDLMVVYYSLAFHPIRAIEDCIAEPIVIDIQGHALGAAGLDAIESAN